MKQSVVDAINAQMRDELYSGYLYLAMAAHFGAENLEGFGRWMRLQAQEELQHAMRLYDYVIQAGGRVELHAIDQPPSEYGTPLSIFRQALEHEREVTSRIHALYALARSENDYPTELALQWFVTEQVQEEDNAAAAVDQLELAGDNKAALLMLDGQFGLRAATD
jgi:ferritin